MNLAKLQDTKINTNKWLAFLYTNNEKSEREIKETIPFNIRVKRKTYKGIKLPKETEHMYAETIRHWWKKSKMTKTDREIYVVLGLEKSIL